MHAISDNAVSQQSLAAHSIATYRAGETVLSAASTTGQALEESKFHFVSTAAPLMQDSVAVPYIATVVQRREDSANRAQAELKRQVQDGQLSSITRRTIDKIEELLGASGGNLVYAGYPYDPFVLDT